MLTTKEYLNYLKASVDPFSFEKGIPPIFEDLFTTVQDFNFYLGELKEYQQNITSKKDIIIISVKKFLKIISLEKSVEEQLRKFPPDELLLFDTSKLGTKIRRAFENTLFRVSIYRDNVVLIVNELGYFWLKEEPKHLLPSMLESKRILLFPGLHKVLKQFTKPPLKTVLEIRNKITHKTHLKIKLRLGEKTPEQLQEVLIEAYESSSPSIRAYERLLGGTKTIRYYVEILESLYPAIIDINGNLTNYYRTKFDPAKWRRSLDKLLGGSARKQGL